MDKQIYHLIGKATTPAASVYLLIIFPRMRDLTWEFQNGIPCQTRQGVGRSPDGNKLCGILPLPTGSLVAHRFILCFIFCIALSITV
ncbi:hypothetical protein F5141DRAFT_1120513 [Pisolithus sp. B1]|nr:hypothetical protein F5141DRAFT_1120513 [Pisolithus sp. B1]